MTPTDLAEGKALWAKRGTPTQDALAEEWLWYHADDLIAAAEECGRLRKFRVCFDDPTFPRIVCLCGSTRFSQAFKEANLRETLAGHIVLSIGCDTKSDQGCGLTHLDKAMLDKLHLRKIDLADEVLILNVGGYIGESTRQEIAHAEARGSLIRFLEDPKK